METATAISLDEELRKRIRAENALRGLRTEEEGWGIAKAPSGVFGFTYAPGTETPLFVRRSYHSFEVHKLADGSAQVIGYVTKDEAEALSKRDSLDIRLYPDPHGDATELVVIAFDRLMNSSFRSTREDGNPLPLQVGGRGANGQAAAANR